MNKSDFLPGDIPAKPGVYIFRDKFGKIIYVGKALNLRKRVSQYFRPSKESRANPKFRSLINSIASYDLNIVANDEEALLFESKLIKDYAPYYNILLRDDKRFLMIKITLSERFPRIILARLKKDDGSKYYGPFPHGSAVKSTALFLSNYFKLRLCPYYEPGMNERKYCMDARVKKCSEPCIEKISKADYDASISSVIDILNGKTNEISTYLKSNIAKNAAEMNFEKAALERDILNNINSLFKTKIRNFTRSNIDSTFKSNALEELQKILQIKNKPSRIEAFDISNLSDNFAVASMVSFYNGEPDRKNYRRFKIKTVSGINDFAMMKEAVSRRFKRNLLESKPSPDLLMVDGGKGQLSAAIEALTEIKTEPFPVIGLAKKNEEIFLPGQSEGIILEKSNSALNVLQAIRDESHRFAISFNREIRLKKISQSILDEIEDIGSKRKVALLRAFQSISQLRHSTPQEIHAKTKIVGEKLAVKILDFLNRKSS
ncbi:MAG TPA: excinuclease ABC subunit C [Lentisphaeria bacterium]|nr:MAG: hypothetical protein A2X47_03710 [Lentisphaerae bacterium GWF2_38_69]HBM15213.1 excinuclease ABC subunit C [Lentisphaeria bacterium]